MGEKVPTKVTWCTKLFVTLAAGIRFAYALLMFLQAKPGEILVTMFACILFTSCMGKFVLVHFTRPKESLCALGAGKLLFSCVQENVSF